MVTPLLPLSTTIVLLIAAYFWDSLLAPTHPITVGAAQHGATSRAYSISQFMFADSTASRWARGLGAAVKNRRSTRRPTAQFPGTEVRYSPPDSRSRGRDPLRHHRAIVGRDARIPWYARVRSVMVLIVIVAAFGAALAGATLVLIASGRIILETLAG